MTSKPLNPGLRDERDEEAPTMSRTRKLQAFLLSALLPAVACEGPPPMSPAAEGPTPNSPAVQSQLATSPAGPEPLVRAAARCQFDIGYRSPFEDIPTVTADMGTYAVSDTPGIKGGIHQWPIELHHLPLLQLRTYTHLVGLVGPDCGRTIVSPTMPDGYRLRVLGGPTRPTPQYWFQFTTTQRIDEYFLDRSADILKLRLRDYRTGETLDEVHIAVSFGLARLFWGCWYTVDPDTWEEDGDPPSACASEHGFLLD